jgi:nucleoside triphosphate pyrophosphatase
VRPLVLASGSPRRLQLLEMLQIPCRVVVPNTDETRGAGELPEAYVVRLARAKAGVVAAREPAELVLGADTTVVVRGEVLGKPASEEEAAVMLGMLGGRTHHVMTGVALALGDRVLHALDVTDVTFRPLDRATIDGYVATGEPMDKAGAYAVQGRGAALIEGIRGDFFSVMGLPLRLVLDLLERFGRPYRFTR